MMLVEHHGNVTKESWEKLVSLPVDWILSKRKAAVGDRVIYNLSEVFGKSVATFKLQTTVDSFLSFDFQSCGKPLVQRRSADQSQQHPLQS